MRENSDMALQQSPPTCSVETFQQQVQKLFIDILTDIDLRG